MKLPRDLSGTHLVNMLCKNFGYRRVHRVGSHIVLEPIRPCIIGLRYQNMIIYVSEP
jgi:hypothetical protein